MDRDTLYRIAARTMAIVDVARLERPRTKCALLGLAAAGFLAGIAISIYGQPQIFADLNWWPALLLITVGVPITIGLHATDFALSARLANRRVTLLKACEIVIIGSAASLLPVPGGTLVRVIGLKMAGADYRSGAAATLLVAAFGLGVSFVYAGVAVILLGNEVAGAVLACLGGTALVATLIMTHLLTGSLRISTLVLANKLLMVFIDAVRILWSLSALGFDVNLTEASVFVVAGTVGSAIFIVPSGLGVQEVLSAAVAPLAGVAATAGFLAASVNRMAAMLLIAPLAGMLAWRNRVASARAGSDQTQNEPA